MRIDILPSARNDLAEGFAFYERQAAGLGGCFLDSLSSDIESLCLYAGIHVRAFGAHRMLATRFPYAVYYAVDGENVRVKAVLDCRRDPRRIRRRLANGN